MAKAHNHRSHHPYRSGNGNVSVLRYVVYAQIPDYIRKGWKVAAYFPPHSPHSRYSIIMEKGKLMHKDDPLYDIGCSIKDAQHNVYRNLNVHNNYGTETFGQQLDHTLSVIEEQVGMLNDFIKDVMPHLEEIMDYAYSDEQRSFEEAKEETGEKPEQHIFYSLEALNDFIGEVRGMNSDAG